ncbi:MAG TPA: hypothetical protein VGN01_18335 [Acidobacteriaceae bacterium]|jgi:hypothetical protein
MNTKRSFFGIACRAAAFSFLLAGTASLLQAQQASADGSTTKAPVFLSSNAAPAASYDIFSSSSSSSSSSSNFDSPIASDGHFLLGLDKLSSSQPPPRRRYGRPNYSSGNTNPDGSSKYTFMVGAGAAVPVGNTHVYETPGYDFQIGGGRNFNKTIGVLLQFDYDHFGLQGATLANQTFVYDTLLGCTQAQINTGQCVTGLDGNNHVWSLTVNPTFTLATEGSLGAYVVVGTGYYHKVTNFTQPTTQFECSIYGCGYFDVNATVDHYTSNAIGVNGGIGLTYKFSKFSNERFYVEGRYVFMANENRPGITSQNAATAPANATNLYPANSHRTTFIPITVGLRF